jgi:hypothetical protein
MPPLPSPKALECDELGREWQVSSRSLVFEPSGDVSQPLVRFPYKHIARLLR